MNAREAWSATLGQMQIQLNRATFETWLGRARYVGYEDGRLVVSVPHAYARDWLERNLQQALTDAFSRFLEQASEIQFVVWDVADLQPDVRDVFGLVDDRPAAEVQGALNSSQTFDTFAVTPTNGDAVLFARFVLDSSFGEHPALYVAGSAGVGKTHLLQAMANELAERRLKIVSVSAEQFTTEFTTALRRKEDMQPFHDKYRGCDVLVMDEIEFLEGKDRSQQELRYVWDTLSRRKRLMLFGGRRLPRDLQIYSDLSARLNRWLVCTINPPDADSCAAILALKAHTIGIVLPEGVGAALLSAVNYDLSLLDGALAQVANYAHLTNRRLSADLIGKLLRSRVGVPRANAIEVADVLDATAEHFELTVADLVGKNRSKAIALARQVAMHLARRLTDASLPQIGQALGGRDHTTVLHGCTRIVEALETDPEIRAACVSITDKLRAATSTTATVPTSKPDSPPEVKFLSNDTMGYPIAVRERDFVQENTTRSGIP